MVLMWFSLSVARTMPPNATRPPTVPVPAPETVTGTRSSFARASISETSSMLSGMTTRSAWPSRMKLASVRNDSISSGCDFVCIQDLHDLEFTLAKYFYPVSQFRGLLKLEALRRRTHLNLQPRYCRFDIRRRVVLNLLDLGRHFEVIRFGRRYQRGLDRLHNRLRCDAILTIEHLLYRPPPRCFFNRPLH